jgi:TPR repeat protein
MPRYRPRLNLAALAATVVLGLALAVPLPATAQIDTGTATFNEAVQAVKDKNFRHAVKLFSLQAENDQHDAQYNLAILLEAGKGAPQDFTKALIWAWSAQLGGIEAAEELAEDLSGYLPEKSIEEVREAVLARLQARIEAGSPDAVSEFATFHLQILDEPDYETAYVWFSISAALGLQGALEARDNARDNVDNEKIVDLQSEAGTIYESLNISLD